MKPGHDEHLARWAAAKAAFIKATGRNVSIYALVLVDNQGEIYYGADFGQTVSEQRQMLMKLSALVGDLKERINRSKDSECICGAFTEAPHPRCKVHPS